MSVSSASREAPRSHPSLTHLKNSAEDAVSGHLNTLSPRHTRFGTQTLRSIQCVWSRNSRYEGCRYERCTELHTSSNHWRMRGALYRITRYRDYPSSLFFKLLTDVVITISAPEPSAQMTRAEVLVRVKFTKATRETLRPVPSLPHEKATIEDKWFRPPEYAGVQHIGFNVPAQRTLQYE